VGNVAHERHGNCYNIFIGITEGQSQFERLSKKRREGVDWILMAQVRVQWCDLVNTTMNVRSS